MDENNNENKHAPEVIHDNITDDGSVDTSQDHNTEGTYASSAESQRHKSHTTERYTSSHFSRRNNVQGFQKNSSIIGNKRVGSYRSFKKEKYDKIAAEKLVIDYKQPDILMRFLTQNGKILSRYVTGNSAKNQRRLVREVKRSRFIGLLPSA